MSATSEETASEMGHMQYSNLAPTPTQQTNADLADKREPTLTHAPPSGSKAVKWTVAEWVAECIRKAHAEGYKATDELDQLCWKLARRLLLHDDIDADNGHDLLTDYSPRWSDIWGAAPEEAEFAMNQALDACIYPEGTGPLELAAERASTRPVRLRSEHRKGPRRSRIYEQVLSVARELQERSEGQLPVYLPARKLGQVLGVQRMTAWRCVRLAQEDGVLRLLAPHKFNEHEPHKRKAALWLVDLDRLSEMTASDPTPLQREGEV